ISASPDNVSGGAEVPGRGGRRDQDSDRKVDGGALLALPCALRGGPGNSARTRSVSRAGLCFRGDGRASARDRSRGGGPASLHESAPTALTRRLVKSERGQTPGKAETAFRRSFSCKEVLSALHSGTTTLLYPLMALNRMDTVAEFTTDRG